MKNNLHTLGTISIATLLGLLSLLIGNRHIDVGADTKSYVRAYERTVNCQCLGSREFGFEIFSLLLAKLGASTTVFLLSLSFINFLLLIIFCQKISDHLSSEKIIPKDSRLAVSALLVGLTLLSPLTLSSQINGIRQGIAAFSLGIVILEISRERYLYSLPFIIVAIASHNSTIMYLISILIFYFLLFKVQIQVIVIVIIASFLTYVSGLSQKIIYIYAPRLYLFVNSYGDEFSHRLKSGVRFDFALFTIFLLLFLYILNIISQQRRHNKFLNRFFVYISSSAIPFFALGWGYYSNRYLFTTWILMTFFAGVVVASILSKIRLIKSTSTITFLVGFAVFFYRFTASGGISGG